MEIWKIISTHQNYEVSNLGRIRRTDTKQIKIPSVATGGYLKVTLYPNPKTLMVHRLVAIEFLENVEGKLQVNHIDSNRQNNNLSNLEWCTCKENMQHCAKANRAAKHDGVNNPTARFSEEEIIYIRSSDKQSLELAKEFGVHATSISAIRTGKKYKTSGGNIQIGQRTYKGFNHPSKVLTEIQEVFIRNSSESNRYLADLFSVSIDSIRKAKKPLALLKTCNDYPKGE